MRYLNTVLTIAVVAMCTPAAHRHTWHDVRTVNGLQLYYETRDPGRPLVLLHGGLLTIDLNWGRCSNPWRPAGR
jgi:hypothetical protein